MNMSIYIATCIYLYLNVYLFIPTLKSLYMLVTQQYLFVNLFMNIELLISIYLFI